MSKFNQYDDILDMDVLKHEVKVTHTHLRPYELTGFLEYAFKGNKLYESTFLRMDDEFKEELYQTVKFFETDSSASNNPFYINKYKQLFNQLSVKVKQNNINHIKQIPIIQPITITQADFGLFQSENGKEKEIQINSFGKHEKIIDDNDLTNLDLEIDNTKLFGKSSRQIENYSNNTLSQSKTYIAPAPIPFQHKFQMPGAGSAAIFDVELQPSAFDLVDDQFGQAAKPTIEPMFKLKNSQALGKSIVMDSVNLNKIESIVNIDDLINIGKVTISKPLNTQELIIPLNSNIPIHKEQDQFQNNFSHANQQQAIQLPKASIFELKLDDQGNEQLSSQQILEDCNQKHQDEIQNKGTTDKDSQFTQLQDAKQQVKDPKQLENDIYKSIEQIQTQEVKAQEPLPNHDQIKQQQSNKGQSIQKQDIFEMELQGIPQVQKLQLLPIQIKPIVVKTPQEQNAKHQTTNNSKSSPQSKHQVQRCEINCINQQVSQSHPTYHIGFPQTKRINQVSSIQIPEQLMANTLPLWRQFYNKKNYECQIEFYKQLKQELFRLEYFDKIQIIEEEVEIVKEIKRLSDEYSKCVDMDEEELVHAVIKGIQKKINSLNKEEIKEIADMCISRNGKTITGEIYQEIVSRKQFYEQTLKRLGKTLKIPQKKLEAFIQVGIISLCCKENILSKCKQYKIVIEKIFKQFDEYKSSVDKLKLMDQQSTIEVLNSSKYQQYLVGFKKYYSICLKLSQVIRLIEGQNSFRFKLNKLRIQLNKIFSYLQTQWLLYISPIEQQNPNIAWLSEYMNIYLQYLSTGSFSQNIYVCGICFDTKLSMVQKQGALYHPSCWNLIKRIII